MTEDLRKELDAFELLMQDHREIEAMISEFDYMRRKERNTGRVIADACAELEIQVALQAGIFCAAVGEAAGGDAEVAGLLDEIEADHNTMSGLIDKVRQAPADDPKRHAYFAALAEHVKHHVLGMETKLFPLARKLKGLDLDSVTVAIKKRKAELIDESGVAEEGAETV